MSLPRDFHAARAHPEPPVKTRRSTTTLGFALLLAVCPLARAAPATLSGRVVDAAGAGVAEARVAAVPTADWSSHCRELLEGAVGTARSPEVFYAVFRQLLSDAESFPATRSDVRGDFRLNELEPGEYRLFVEHPRFPSSERLVHVDPRRERPLEIALHRGTTITGRIVDDRGKPVPGASVETIVVDFLPRESKSGAWMLRVLQGVLEGRVTVSRRARSGADGTFELAGLDPVYYDLVARSEGFARTHRNRVAAGSARVTIELDRGIELSGTVVGPAGRIEGARVEWQRTIEKGKLRYEHLLDEPSSTESGPSGAFRFGGLEPGKWVLRVLTPEHAVWEQELVLPGEALDHIRLEEAWSISGHVLSPDGLPVEGARVWVPRFRGEVDARARDFGSTPLALVETVSDASGHFTLTNLSSGKHPIVAFTESYPEGRLEDVEAGTRGAIVRLERGLVVTGRVLDAEDGEPVAGMNVRFGVKSKIIHVGTSDEQGNFRVAGIPGEDGKPPGRSTLAVRVQGSHYEPLSRNVAAEEASGQRPLQLRVTRRPAVSGRVVDEHGQPIAGARVALDVAGIPEVFLLLGGHALQPAYTADDGAFRLLLFEGQGPGQPLDVVASHPRFASMRTPVGKLDGTGNLPAIEVTLSRGVEIRVEVADEAGAPVAGARLRIRGKVHLEGPLASLYAEFNQDRYDGVAYTDSRGEHVFARFGDGTYELEAVAVGYSPYRVDDLKVGTQGVTHKVVPQRGRSIGGRIVDENDLPLVGVEVVGFREADLPARFARDDKLLRQARGNAEARTDADGHYRLENLEDGSYAVAARHPEYDIACKIGVDGAEDVGDLVLTRRAEVYGQIRAGDTGRPLVKFQAQLTKAPTERHFPMEESPQRFEHREGLFVFPGVKPDRYDFRVEVDGYAPFAKRIDVLKGQSVELDVVLQPASTLRGVVEDASTRRPIDAVRLRLRKERSEEEKKAAKAGGGLAGFLSMGKNAAKPLEVKTGPDGAFAFGGLGEGVYLLRAFHDYYRLPERQREVSFEVAAVQSQETVLRLEAVGRLRGKIADLESESKKSIYLLVVDHYAESYDWSKSADSPTRVRAVLDRKSGECGPFQLAPGRYVLGVQKRTRRRGELKGDPVPVGEATVSAGETLIIEAFAPEPFRRRD